MFENVLEQGSCYIIQNLLVAEKDNKFRGSNHDFKLTLMKTTTCMKTDCTNIPENYFDFVAFTTISVGVDDTFLIGQYLNLYIFFLFTIHSFHFFNTY